MRPRETLEQRGGRRARSVRAAAPHAKAVIIVRAIQTDKLQQAKDTARNAQAPKPVGSDGMPQHLSEDDRELDEVGTASADSFPASDPPSTSVPTKLG